MGPWVTPVQKGGVDAVSEPLCFVLMPFGKKPDGSGGAVDFDAVYRELIAPAIDTAGLEPLRADEESTGGIIHKPMFERLILCEFAVADLTTANANVFYELGVRHAVRPWSTVLVFAEAAGCRSTSLRSARFPTGSARRGRRPMRRAQTRARQTARRST